jgi:hypothetical protein
MGVMSEVEIEIGWGLAFIGSLLCLLGQDWDTLRRSCRFRTSPLCSEVVLTMIK